MTWSTPFENVTLCSCNHFSIIPSHYSSKLCSKYPGIKLESAATSEIWRWNWKLFLKCPHRLHYCKTGHFMSWKGWEQLWDLHKIEKHTFTERKITVFHCLNCANLWCSCHWHPHDCLSSLLHLWNNTLKTEDSPYNGWWDSSYSIIGWHKTGDSNSTQKTVWNFTAIQFEKADKLYVAKCNLG